MLIPVLEHEKADGHWPSAEKIARIESDKVHVQVYPMKYEEMQALGNYMLDTRPFAPSGEHQKKQKKEAAQNKPIGNGKDAAKNVRGHWSRAGLFSFLSSRANGQKVRKEKKWPLFLDAQMRRSIIYENKQLIFEGKLFSLKKRVPTDICTSKYLGIKEKHLN